ncbi:MAG: hypothetical protein HOM55_10220 [Proteobacteria bacterium]|jgi:hypothetical protein|nr:hypothetical protein [Pseudomonadota bacterium]
MRRCALLLVLMCGIQLAHAARIINGDVDRNDGIFNIEYLAEVDVSPEVLASAILNYEDYIQLSPLVEEIRFSQAATDFPQIDIRLRICILYLCRSVNKLTDVIVRSPREFEFRGIDGAGDFEQSREILRVVEIDGNPNRAIFEYSAKLNPNFFVPPFIGSWLVARQVRRELMVTLGRLEDLHSLQ